MPEADIHLYVIIPVYGNWEDTLECLELLAGQNTRAFHVLIADDGSPSPPPAAIERFHFVSYLRGTHRGFGGNCNFAAAEAMARGATHLLFLNNDTTFAPEFIEGWRLTIASLPRAILSPVICCYDEPSRVWYSGGRLTLRTPFLKERRRYESVEAVDIVSGCAILVPAQVYRDLGGFSHRYRMYFEDLDFTLRARKRGIGVYVVPDAPVSVLHKGSGSFRRTGAWPQQYHYLTSRLIFVRDHFGGGKRMVGLGLCGLHLAVTTLRCLPELPEARILWKSILQGFEGQNVPLRGTDGL